MQQLSLLSMISSAKAPDNHTCLRINRFFGFVYWICENESLFLNSFISVKHHWSSFQSRRQSTFYETIFCFHFRDSSILFWIIIQIDLSDCSCNFTYTSRGWILRHLPPWGNRILSIHPCSDKYQFRTPRYAAEYKSAFKYHSVLKSYFRQEDHSEIRLIHGKPSCSGLFSFFYICHFKHRLSGTFFICIPEGNDLYVAYLFSGLSFFLCQAKLRIHWMGSCRFRFDLFRGPYLYLCRIRRISCPKDLFSILWCSC